VNKSGNLAAVEPDNTEDDDDDTTRARGGTLSSGDAQFFASDAHQCGPRSSVRGNSSHYDPFPSANSLIIVRHIACQLRVEVDNRK